MARWLSRERRWRDALLAAVLPAPSDRSLPAFDSLDLGDFWDRVDEAAPLTVKAALRVAVWSLALSPPLLLRRPVTFRHLDRDAQDALLARAARSRLYPLRQMVEVLKLMTCFAYFKDDGVRSAVDPERGGA